MMSDTEFPPFLTLRSQVDGWLEQTCRLDADGQPIALTVEIVGFGRYLIPIVLDGGQS